MAAVAVTKKKPTNPADRLPRDGLTGMGSGTQRHFIEVKQKMIDFVSQQEAIEYDGEYPPPPPSHHHHHHHSRHHELISADGKKASKPRSQPHTPVASLKRQPAHRGPSTPQAVRRG